MFQMIKSQHEATRMEHRKRLSRAEIENKAAVAALACYSVDQIRYFFGNPFSNLMHICFEYKCEFSTMSILLRRLGSLVGEVTAEVPNTEGPLNEK